MTPFDNKLYNKAFEFNVFLNLTISVDGARLPRMLEFKQLI